MLATSMKNTFLKRFKVTRTGKVLRRKMAQNHFRAKKTGNQIRGKRGEQAFDPSVAKLIRKIV